MDNMPTDSELHAKHDLLRANNMPLEAFEKASDEHHFKRRKFFQSCKFQVLMKKVLKKWLCMLL